MTRRAARVLFGLWLAGVALLSLAPLGFKRSLQTAGPWHDPAHVIAFGVASFLLHASVAPAKRPLCVAALLTMVVGIEALEWLVYGSPFEGRDIVVGAVGVFAGALVALAANVRASGAQD